MQKEIIETYLRTEIGKIKYFEYLPPNSFSKIIICAPGFVESAENMIKSLLSLSDNIDAMIIAIEWRGQGAEVGTTSVTIETLANDLFEVVNHMKKSHDCSITLLAHSMGVNVVWRYVEKFVEFSIDRYIFVDQPVAITGSSLNGYKKEWVVHSRLFGYIIAGCCLLKNILLPIINVVKPNMISKSFRTYLNNCNSWSLAVLAVSSTISDNTHRVSLVTRPCLIYGGEASFVKPDVARWIASKVSGARRLIIYPAPYGTHTPFVSDGIDNSNADYGARRFIKDVTSFIKTDEKDLESF